MRRLILVAITMLLVACDPNSGYQYPTRPIPVPVLEAVTLNQPFTIRPDRASEFIQDGEIRPYERITEYYPHCIFGLRTVSGQARTVQPETFHVTAIHRDRFMALAGGTMLASGGGDNGYGMVMSITRLDLHSSTQPEVFRLTCQQLDDAARMHHLSIAAMQQALGEMFTLH
jgi:hypothetical protein